MSEPNTTPPAKARQPRSDPHKGSRMGQRSSPNIHNPRRRPEDIGQPQQYDDKTQNSLQTHELIPEYIQSNTNPQTPARTRRQKPLQNPHDRQPHGKPASTTKKRSGLRNVSQSGDELAPSNIHNMDGAGYHSADATSISIMNHTTTPARQAYAGPTFHASPAASTLPLPKNFAKSLPADTPKSRLQAQVDRDAADEDTRFRSPSPRTSQLFPPRSEQDSPIDFLLNAHRAQQRTSKDNGPSNDRPVSWNEDSRLRRPDSNSNTPRPQGPGTPGSMSNKEMFMMEVDGANEELEAEDPSNVVPFRQRMSDLRITSELQPNRTHAETEEEQRLAKSKALKDLLFTASDQPARASSHPEVPHYPPHFAQSPNHHPYDPFEENKPGLEGANNRALFVPEHDQWIQSSSQNRLQSGSQAGQRYPGAAPNPSNKSQQMNKYGPQHNWDQYEPHGYPRSQPPLRQGFPYSPEANAGAGSGRGASGYQAQTTGSDQDVVAMEDSLRRMLKLEKPGGSGGPAAR